MQRFTAVVLDSLGVPISGVTVTVQDAASGGAVGIFADNRRTVKANPFLNDLNGSFEFYAPNGRYNIVPTKTGVVLPATDATDLLFFDPQDADDYVRLYSDFLTEFVSSTTRLYDGGLVLGGATGLVALQAALRGGVLRVAETGGVAGKVKLVDGTGAQVTPFGVTAAPLIMEMGLEKVADGQAGTRRAGLSVNDLATDPADGIFVRQIDANNAFVVSRASSVESTLTLDQTLNDRSRVRCTITTGEIRVALDGVDKGGITTNIPAALLGWAIFGGATASGGGLDLDYLDVWMKR